MIKDRLMSLLKLWICELILISLGVFYVGTKIGKGTGDILDILYWIAIIGFIITFCTIKMKDILKDITDKDTKTKDEEASND